MTGTDLAEFEQANQTPGAKCGFARQLERLDQTRRDTLDAALEAKHIQHAAIVRVLRKWDIAATSATVARHRPPVECRSCG